MSSTGRIDWLFEAALVLGALGVGSAVVGSAALLSGSFVSATEAEPTAVSTSSEAEAAEPIDSTRSDEVVPLLVHIPDIGVEADVIDLGLNPDRSLEVPQNYEETGWYTGASLPGEPGPSVIAGHVDSRTGPAVFYELDQLEVGDVVFVDRSDGLTARYRVTRLTNVEKEEFPTSDVYGSTEDPTLRLITCGGSFDYDARSYTGNVVVYAEHLGNVATAQDPTPD